ncbi:phage major tail tube protein [Pseudoalteromonas luteoviolacea]|uniref:phage major tail tube protein n=1 Tax=Pseudoalteromonas luteoviolacea TaxID=43657 RepID=UPI0011539343|nr:phage major tail tube protein [Pseudoalteromonas luteoviolacea]TQF69541.1 phage major tail tube protein [Pseudoalteromonas luteoviolacea]
MGLELPKVLKNFNLMVDGIGYGGRCKSIQLPKLTRKTVELEGAGLDAPIEVDMGQEKIELPEIVLFETPPDIITQFGTGRLDAFRVRVLGAIKRDNSNIEEPIEITMQGAWKELDMGTWQRGDIAELKLSGSLIYYKLVIAGRVIFEIDKLNGIHNIDGVDVLAQRRAILEL